jgi:hypothetical protein
LGNWTNQKCRDKWVGKLEHI